MSRLYTDVMKALTSYQYWLLVSFLNVVVQYRESKLGPFWISGSIGIFVVLLGSLYALIFDLDRSYFIPYLAIGYIVWHLISGTIIQSLALYRKNKNYILQSRMVLPVYNFQLIFEILLIFVHNLVLLLLIFMVFQHWPGFIGILLFSLGMIAILVTMLWVTILLGLLGAAYRDLSEFINIIMRIAFLATPIIWQMGKTGNREAVESVMFLNPFYHYIEIVRAPLMNETMNSASWPFVIIFTLCGVLASGVVYAKFHRKVVGWT